MKLVLKTTNFNLIIKPNFLRPTVQSVSGSASIWPSVYTFKTHYFTPNTFGTFTFLTLVVWFVKSSILAVGF